MWKNFFWLDKEPKDEREQELLMRASQRSLKALLSVLTIIWVIFLQLPGSVAVHAWMIQCTLFVLIFGVFMVPGWLTLKDEVMEFRERKPASGFTFRNFFIAVFAVMMFWFFLMQSSPETYFIMAIIEAVIIHLFVMAFVWHQTVGRSLPGRIFFTLIIPELALGYFLGTKVSTGRRVLQAILFPLGLIAAQLMLAAIVRSVYVEPMYISTNYFEPDLSQNAYVLVEKQAGQFKEGDFIIFENEGRNVVGRVTAVNESTISAESSTTTRELDQKQIVGKINQTYFGHDWIAPLAQP